MQNMFSKYAGPFRPISWHVWGNLYDHLMSTKISNFVSNKRVHMSSKNNERNGYMQVLGVVIMLR